MDISLSIESFPLAEKTTLDMQRLLDLFKEDYGTILHAPAWQTVDARGYAVLAYTEKGELMGFAAALDLVGLHQYEWSLIVHPDVRRQSLGSALVDGIQYGLQQRQAEGELAAFLDEAGAAAFLKSLGYAGDFKEIQFGAEPLETYNMPEGVAIAPYAGQQDALEALLAAAFDEEVIPVIAYNIEEAGRGVWMMENRGRLVAAAAVIEEEAELWITAFAVNPQEQGKGYGQTFLKWCRHFAFNKGKRQVLLDADTAGNSLHIYEKAGFQPLNVVQYWKKEDR